MSVEVGPLNCLKRAFLWLYRSSFPDGREHLPQKNGIPSCIQRLYCSHGSRRQFEELVSYIWYRARATSFILLQMLQYIAFPKAIRTKLNPEIKTHQSFPFYFMPWSLLPFALSLCCLNLLSSHQYSEFGNRVNAPKYSWHTVGDRER